ncbi:MAG: hypothetical protein ABSB35_18850 [Bryobacteraceae bacterium]
MDTFSTVEVMFEFSKAIRHGVIALEGLNELDGVDREKVSALAASVRHAHAEATAYMVTLIGAGSAATTEIAHRSSIS